MSNEQTTRFNMTPEWMQPATSEKKKIRVRIQNDGTSSWNTQITDLSTGTPLEHVQALSLQFDLNNPEHRKRDILDAQLTVGMPVIDIIADAEIRKVCPCCGRSVEEGSNGKS